MDTGMSITTARQISNRLEGKPSPLWTSSSIFHLTISDTWALTQLNLTMPFPFQISEHVIDGQYIREYPRATAAPDSPLKLCIKQYTPIDNPNPQPGDVTIVATHGTGFPKVCLAAERDKNSTHADMVA